MFIIHEQPWSASTHCVFRAGAVFCSVPCAEGEEAVPFPVDCPRLTESWHTRTKAESAERTSRKRHQIMTSPALDCNALPTAQLSPDSSIECRRSSGGTACRRPSAHKCKQGERSERSTDRGDPLSDTRWTSRFEGDRRSSPPARVAGSHMHTPPPTCTCPGFTFSSGSSDCICLAPLALIPLPSLGIDRHSPASPSN